MGTSLFLCLYPETQITQFCRQSCSVGFPISPTALATSCAPLMDFGRLRAWGLPSGPDMSIRRPGGVIVAVRDPLLRLRSVVGCFTRMPSLFRGVVSFDICSSTARSTLRRVVSPAGSETGGRPPLIGKQVDRGMTQTQKTSPLTAIAASPPGTGPGRSGGLWRSPSRRPQRC